MIRSCTAALSAFALAWAVGRPACAAPRTALWTVVRACALKARLTGSPWPCLEVDAGRGIAVVPDPKRRAHLLLSPLRRIPGVESPELLVLGGPGYWWEAWTAAGLLAPRVGRPLAPEDLALAVNSVSGRTQDQLHIHIGCVRASVRREVDAQLADVGDTWAELPRPLRRGNRYRARWLPRGALRTNDPFRLAAADPAAAGGRAADLTLALLAARRPDGEDGFVLLTRRADPAAGDLGAAEELLDLRCAASRPDPEAVPQGSAASR